MERRAFMKIVASATAARGILDRGPLFADSTPPKVFVFGMAIVQKGKAGVITIDFPTVGGHSAFMVAEKQLVQDLGGKAIPTENAGLAEAHDDLPGLLDSMACVPQAPGGLTSWNVGQGPVSSHRFLDAYLPNVLQIAQSFEGKTFALNVTSGLRLQLAGGYLRPPFQPSRNAGTHGVPWQFYYAGVAKGDTCLLTDMLVFQSTASELPITAGAKTATLKTGQSLWLFNVPTTDPPVDETPQIVEHAHDYFEILSPPLDHPENALIQTWTRYDRIPPKRNVGRFVHPCAIAPLRADSQAHPLATPAIVYFPPDTDPCFLVQA